MELHLQGFMTCNSILSEGLDAEQVARSGCILHQIISYCTKGINSIPCDSLGFEPCTATGETSASGDQCLWPSKITNKVLTVNSREENYLSSPLLTPLYIWTIT